MQMIGLREFVKRRNIFVVAHRGASDYAKENTLRAFEQAIADGSHMLECDVQITRDKKVIVYHDYFFRDETKPISDLNYEYLIANSLGKNDESIPRLDSLIEMIHHRAYLMIEIKHTAADGFEDDMDRIIAVIEKYNYAPYTLIGSFNYQVLKYLRKKYPEYPLAAIKLPTSDALPSEIYHKYGFEVFICSIDELNRQIEQDARSHNIFLGVYSVDSEEEYKKTRDYSIAAFATNNPKFIAEKLKVEQAIINNSNA